jgi:hypothetical protein
VVGNKEATQMAQGLALFQTVSSQVAEASSEKTKTAANDFKLLMQQSL